jgi:hypothetical protein
MVPRRLPCKQAKAIACVSTTAYKKIVANEMMMMMMMSYIIISKNFELFYFDFVPSKY